MEDRELYMKYVGVCALLARISHHVRDDVDRQCVEMALQDCANSYPDRLKLAKAGRGWIIEPKFPA